MEKKITNGDDPINMATTDSGHVGAVSGLTKREYFAAMALQGICASDVQDRLEHITEGSVIIADELIKALNK